MCDFSLRSHTSRGSHRLETNEEDDSPPSKLTHGQRNAKLPEMWDAVARR